MSLLQSLRKTIRNTSFVRKFIAYYVVPSGFFDKKVLNMAIGESFRYRISEVVACPDNKFIHRVEGAGLVKKGKQLMHNGLLINLGSYYGPEVAQQLFANKGVHEPQEEYVFQEVLKTMAPGATMIELGAFWSFYSMWFQKEVPGARNYMVEPDEFNLGCGVRNFALNKMKGSFTKAFVGSANTTDDKGTVTIGVDDFCADKSIHFIDMLHCDIQGFEYEMLTGAKKMMQQDKIGYFFISTHSNEVHYKCLNLLTSNQYAIVASSDLDQTYAEDGLIVAKSKNYKGPEAVHISLKVK
ncbi:MAG: FkbM family methyltransferase [Bacteroidota bacterium]